MKRILLLAALLLVAIPTASATVTVTATDGDLELVSGESSTIPVTVTVTCDEFIMAGAQELTYTISSDARSDWGAAYPDITVAAGAGCVPGMEVSATEDITFTPDSDAFGLLSKEIKIYASNDDTNVSYEREGIIWVAYDPGHTLTPDITFPYTWTGGEQLAFNLTIDVQANSDTMVMFFPVSSAANGSVSGLSDKRFFFTEGDEPTHTLSVTWTPPTGAWDNATITFNQFSHCLLGGELDPCENQMEEVIVWTIQNDAPAPPADANNTPGFGAGALIGVIALAFVAARRR